MMPAQIVVPIDHSSRIGEARRKGAEMASTLGFNEARIGELSLAITEAGTNIIKHAQSGQLVLTAQQRGNTGGVEVLALDRGPGIPNFSRSVRDGHSTAGSLGAGLGTLSRVAGAFEMYTQEKRGTTLRMEFWAQPVPPADCSFEVGAVCAPKPGEHTPGDAWISNEVDGSLSVLVADGLGHGVEAARAAQAAVRTFGSNAAGQPEEIIAACHAALAPTRGAAVAVTRVTDAGGGGSFAGVGNIVCRLEAPAHRRSLVSHNGIVGHTVRKIQQFDFSMPPDGVLVLHSDGLGTQWELASYPGLLSRHASVIAGVLYRDYDRGRDDVTVVVLRYRRPL
jgi:anti-sigma regulatory factor (Ser/Thr protein kinase)